MRYEQTCPRCGEEFAEDDKERLADIVVEHASTIHRHRLDRHIVLAHLDGLQPQ